MGSTLHSLVPFFFFLHLQICLLTQSKCFPPWRFEEKNAHGEIRTRVPQRSWSLIALLSAGLLRAMCTSDSFVPTRAVLDALEQLGKATKTGHNVLVTNAGDRSGKKTTTKVVTPSFARPSRRLDALGLKFLPGAFIDNR